MAICFSHESYVCRASVSRNAFVGSKADIFYDLTDGTEKEMLALVFLNILTAASVDQYGNLAQALAVLH